MELLEGLLSRRSIRHYDAQKTITPADLKTVLQMAMYAPSAMNKRPWEFIVVTDKKMLQEIAQKHPYAAFVPEAGTAVVVCENTAEAFAGHGPEDIALASANFMLAAHGLGYGTCYCGVAPNEDREALFAELLKTPSHIRPYCVIAVGTPLKQPSHPDRVEENKIHYNGW